MCYGASSSQRLAEKEPSVMIPEVRENSHPLIQEWKEDQCGVSLLDARILVRDGEAGRAQIYRFL